MCLAVPGKLVEREGGEGTVDFQGNRVRVNTMLVDDVKVGDWVLVHAGFAIQKLDEEEARATFAVLAEMAQTEQTGEQDTR